MKLVYFHTMHLSLILRWIIIRDFSGTYILGSGVGRRSLRSASPISSPRRKNDVSSEPGLRRGRLDLDPVVVDVTLSILSILPWLW